MYSRLLQRRPGKNFFALSFCWNRKRFFPAITLKEIYWNNQQWAWTKIIVKHVLHVKGNSYWWANFIYTQNDGAISFYQAFPKTFKQLLLPFTNTSSLPKKEKNKFRFNSVSRFAQERAENLLVSFYQPASAAVLGWCAGALSVLCPVWCPSCRSGYRPGGSSQ